MKTLHYFIVLIMVGSISACDFSTGSTDSTAQEGQEKFSVNADASNRIIFGENDSPAKTIGTDGELEFVAKLTPPTIDGNRSRASHIDVTSSGEIVVGYKVQGNDYGGGIDILNFNADRQHTLRELTSQNIDVQEVLYFDGSLYVAAATEKKGAVVLQVNPGNGTLSEYDMISGHVAKALALNAADDELFVVSDLNHLYKYNISNSNTPFAEKDSLLADDDVEFRSVGARSTNQSSSVTADTQGNIYRTNNFNSGFKLAVKGSGGDNIYNNKDLQIARVSYFTSSAPDVVFVSQNEYGFKILNPAGETVWWDSQESSDIDDEGVNNRYYLSVTGYYPCNDETYKQPAVVADPTCGGDIYAAATGDIIDYFRYTEQGNSPGSVQYIEKINLKRAFDDIGDGQISDIYKTRDHLIVAKGTEGVYIFKRTTVMY